MLNPAFRALLVVAGVAATLAAGYAVAGGDRTGIVVLAFLTLAALVAGVVTFGTAVPDVAPLVGDDAPPPDRRSVSVAEAARGSAWPAGAAVAVSVMAAGAAVGIPVVLAGLLLALIVAGGWFATVWREHPSWTRPVRERVASRLLVPVGLPVATALLTVVIAVSLSRVLLAIPKSASVVVALIVAVAILLACAWVASRPRLGSSVVVALSVLAAASVVGAGIAGVVAGERSFEHHEAEEKPLTVSARQIQFNKDILTVPAHEEVMLEFINYDEGIYHNVAVYAGEGPDAKPIFNGEGFPGEGERTYTIDTPPPGTYTFVCDFHPNMEGKFVSEGR